MRLFSFIFVLLFLTIAVSAQMTPAFSAADLDAAQCIAYDGGKVVGNAPMPALEGLLGLRADVIADSWTAPKFITNKRYFRVAFNKPIEIGTICTDFSGETTVFWFAVNLERTVSYLKPDAAYPGDITTEEQWVTLPMGAVKTLPKGVSTRALRFAEVFPSMVATPSSDQYQTPASKMGGAVCFKERYYNPTVLGKQRSIAGKPPVWFGYWRDNLPVAGFVIIRNRVGAMTSSLKVEYLKNDATDHATIAPTSAWKRGKDAIIQEEQLIYRFDQPVETKSLRITPDKYAGDFEYTVRGALYALSPLGDTADPPKLTRSTAPFTLPYNMPMTGRVAIIIQDKAIGKNVRRLVAEVDRTAGKIMEPWDLKDDAGQYVPPGEYIWKGTACPPLKLTYELTVNNSGNPPWWAPVRGGGSWMADHSPPVSIGTIGGKTMIMGSTVSEKGQAAISTDLDGNKLWGESPVLTGWGGGFRVTSDGRYGYIMNNYGIQRVDPEVPDFAPTEIYKFNWTPEIPGVVSWGGEDLGGMAAKGDKLYIAYNAPPTPWITPSIKDGIDPKKCLPYIRNTHEYKESEYDDITRLNSTFSIGSAPNTTVAYFGDAPTAGPLGGTLTVAFRKPTPVGSVMVPDAAIKVYALKPGAKLANDPDVIEDDMGGGVDDNDCFDPEKWIPLTTEGKAGTPAIAVIDKGVQTEALRFKTKRLAYATVLSRRYEDVAGQGEMVPLEGTVTAKGGWKVARKEGIPINDDTPALMGLIWKEPKALRGVSLSYPTTASMAVDAYIGADNADPKEALTDDDQWKQVGFIQIEIFSGYWPQTASVRNIDFPGGVTTRALRFRAVLAAGVLGVQGFKSAVPGPQIAGFDGLVVYSHLGAGDPELPPTYCERISEFKLPQDKTGKVEMLRQIPISKPGYLAFGKDGELYAISDKRLVRVPLDGKGEPVEVLPKGMIEKPMGIAFDADGLLYAIDQGPAVVKVFDINKAKQVRIIGTPGGLKTGVWDGLHFNNPWDLTIDGNGKLWVVEHSMAPKRISRWSRDGKLEKSFLGPASYGGGGAYGGAGWLDPKDISQFYFDGMKFKIDWKTRNWKLDSIVYRPGLNSPERSSAPNRVLYYQGHRYLVGDPRVYNEIAVICEEKNNVAVPVVAAGPLTSWKNVNKYPDLKKAFSTLVREKYGFLWMDENRDGIPQLAEVKLTDKYKLSPSYWGNSIGENLSLNFAGVRLPLQSIRADGMPIYDIDKVQILPLSINTYSTWTNADNSTFILANYMLTPDGNTKLWEYPDPGISVQKYYPVPNPRPAGSIVAEFGVTGHITVGKEEYFATNNNYGDWFLFTKDGLLTSWVFGGPVGHGRKHWTMPEYEPGKNDLSDVRLDAEDFYGSIINTDDGKVYLSAGGNHNSIVRVDGLEQVQRIGGNAIVAAADLEKTKAWEIERALFDRELEEPKIAKVPYIEKESIAVDGALDEWPGSLFRVIDQHTDEITQKVIIDAKAAMAYNSDNLYIAVQVNDSSPLMHTAGDFHEIFKHGDAVDIALGTDAKAPMNRTQPVEGDLRIIIAKIKDKPVAVVYRPVVPDAPRDKRTRFYTPAGGEVWIDVVKIIEGADIAFSPDTRSWSMEAAIPWESLGVEAPAIDSKLRGDFGILVGDDNGMRTVERKYWSGKTQTTVADVPTEARMLPALWGELQFIEPDDSIKFGLAD
ncbi:MAG: hypothetical protein WCO98_02220 [bacterium]